MTLWKLLVGGSTLASLVSAQFPPTPEGVAIKDVSSYPGVSISYKRTTICETKAKAWAGYVHMPISYLSDIETSEPYNVSMFFWYVQAREDPDNAPTGIYLAGGPGQSSLYGAAMDGGPCTVNPNSNSTSDNPYSMNNRVNMLYVDQPVGTGYSYDALIKSTLDLTFHGDPQKDGTGVVPFASWGNDLPAQNTTFLYGTLPSQNPYHTSNTTGVAAVTFWHFAQAWFGDFPKHTTSNSRVAIWGNSYGGYWVTATAAYIKQQNQKIQSGSMTGTVIDLDTIGFTNGCVDQRYQAEAYISLAYKNVYDLQLISKTEYEQTLKKFNSPKGCLSLIKECQELGELYDPEEFAVNKTVNDLCLAAEAECVANAMPYPSNRSPFDMAHLLPDPYPPSYLLGFFNQEWVQKDLGVPVNLTGNSNLLVNLLPFAGADPYRRTGMKDVEYLLAQETKITLIYGDRDYRCPWLGMENLSLKAKWDGADAFNAAGYADIYTNSSYKGGVVREHGNLSFSRVFQAGHDAYPYQPETIYNLFDRAMFNKDLATGTISISSNYSTKGPSSCENIKLTLPAPPPPSCYLWAMSSTCTTDQLAAVEDGSAEIVDFTVEKPAKGGGPIQTEAESKPTVPSNESAKKSAGTSMKSVLPSSFAAAICFTGILLPLTL